MDEEMKEKMEKLLNFHLKQVDDFETKIEIDEFLTESCLNPKQRIYHRLKFFEGYENFTTWQESCYRLETDIQIVNLSVTRDLKTIVCYFVTRDALVK